MHVGRHPMSFTELRYDVADGVATITLDRPRKLNAVTATTIDELVRAFDSADGDDAVRAVIVTGAGRAFCAGADLEAGGRAFEPASRVGDPATRGWDIATHRDGGGLVTLRIFDMKKPVIAAINGPAVGFGITLTLPMDVRLASTAARIGFVFARRGVVSEACSTWFLPRLVGIQQAAEWTYTGRVFDAEHLEAVAQVARAHAAGAARPARHDGLDDHAIARAEAAGRRRLGDLGEGLVADDPAARDAMVEMALEDVQVGAADPDAAHAQQRLALAR